MSTHRSRSLFLARIGLVLFGITSLAAQPARPNPPAARSERFAFHSSVPVNLHHFLYQWAKGEVPVPDKTKVEELLPGERNQWERVLAHYQEKVVGRDLLFGVNMPKLRDRLVGKIPSPTGLPLVEETVVWIGWAQPIYEKVWWPDHERNNLQWIKSLVPHIQQHEDSMSRKLTAAYDGQWPRGRLRVDVSYYANRVGGYTTSDGHITIATSARLAPLPWAFELVFHEVSHADPLEMALHRELGEAFGAADGKPPRDLWHMMIFYTAGELTRQIWEGTEFGPYRVYGKESGLYARRAGRPELIASLDKHWRPYLQGKLERSEAMEGLAREILSRPVVSSNPK